MRGLRLIILITERTRHPIYGGSSLLISASSHLVSQPPCSRPQNTTESAGTYFSCLPFALSMGVAGISHAALYLIPRAMDVAIHAALWLIRSASLFSAVAWLLGSPVTFLPIPSVYSPPPTLGILQSILCTHILFVIIHREYNI